MTGSLNIKRRYLVLPALLCVALAATLFAVRSAVSSPPYPVTVPDNLSANLELDPEDVATIVLQRLGDGATIDRVIAVATDADVSRIEPHASSPTPEVEPIGPVWVVRAHGKFVGMRGAPGVTQTVSNTGFFVILDSDGIIIEMGMP